MESLKERIAAQLSKGEIPEVSLAALLGALWGRLGKIATPYGITPEDLAELVRVAAEEIAWEFGTGVEWDAWNRVTVFPPAGLPGIK